jgi:hypothetical protein
MKQKLFLAIGLFLGLTQLNAQTLVQSMYVDFGPTGGTSGAITPSPDANLHYWNNPTIGTLGTVTPLVNANNTATGYNMTVTDNFVVNTTTNYGPTAPTSANLGDLAIGTATQDYFYLETGGSVNPTGQLTISNLDPLKQYKFYAFASRPTTSVRVSNYVFTGASSYTAQIQTSDGTTGNITNILSTPLLFPNASGIITIDLSIVSGSFAYINAMKMEEYSSALGKINFDLNSNIKIYPNPASNNLNIELNDLSNANLQVVDYTGKVVVKQPLNSADNNINIEQLATGVYLFQVNSSEGSLIRKVVKQ